MPWRMEEGDLVVGWVGLIISLPWSSRSWEIRDVSDDARELALALDVP